MTQGLKTPDDGFPDPPLKKRMSAGRVVGIGLGILFLLVVVFVLILLPAVRQKNRAEAREQARNNGRELVSAAQRLHRDHLRLPYNRVNDDGVEILSWRFLLLAHTGMDNRILFEHIDPNLPWDSQGPGYGTDQMATRTLVPVFQSPRGVDKTASITHFVAVIDPASPMSGDKVTFDAIESRDGKSNTALFLEYPGSDINWAEPRDVTLAEAINIIRNSSDPEGTVVAMADGNAIVVPNSASAEDITRLFLLDNGAPQGDWWNG